MDIIQLLPDHVANQIAAGEVIQRPASAVKELLENSIDSGANNIKLIIKDAGRTLIQVVDNGCGMSETDARICFERHATSKIREANDLFAIKSMGFRGEAMASIAAISHVELKTKLYDTDLGVLLTIEGSEVKNQENCACNNGTSISIKNLFFNVPARRNFLKSDQVELKHIIEEFQRVALSHPECALSMYHNNSEVFNLQKEITRQRISSLFGTKYNEKLVPVDEETNLINIKGFVGKPEFARKTRGEQYFFVNNRYIKCSYLHHAVNNAFQGLIANGHHPSYFIFFEVDPKLIDINIHPTKTEIKFDDEKAIYAIVRSSVKHALGQYNIAPSLDFERDPAFDNIPPRSGEIKAPTIKVDSTFNPFQDKKENSSYSPPKKVKTENWEQLFENLPTPEQNKTTQETIESSMDEEQMEEEKIVFQLHKQYILSPIKSGLMIIHQQRAHEKILHEHFLTFEDSEASSQQLLFPKTLELSLKDIAIVKEVTEELNNMGFIFDFLGKSSLIVLGVPSELDGDNLELKFDDLLEKFKHNATAELDNKNNLLISMANSLSIKSGRKMTSIEMSSLINQLFACNNPNINASGKPTLITLTLEEIAKKF